MNAIQRHKVISAIVALMAVAGAAAAIQIVSGHPHDPEAARKAPKPPNWKADFLRRAAARGLSPTITSAPWLRWIGTSRKMPQPIVKAAQKTIKGDGTGPDLGLLFEDARYLQATAGVAAWLVPGSKGVICIFDRTGSSACDVAASVVRRGLPLQVCRTPDQPNEQPSHCALVGITPSSARPVKALVGRRQITIPVDRHTFGYRAARPIVLGALVAPDDGSQTG
jgi:hypothetical protein